MNNFLAILIFISCYNAFGFVQTKTEYNKPLIWQNKNSINLQIKTSTFGNTTSLLSQSEIQNIFNESINNWNNYSPLYIQQDYTTQITVGAGINSVEFSNDPTMFGSGVLAVTSLDHSAATGEIYSADIYINDTPQNFMTFSSVKSSTGSSYTYLGDVFTHELGHFLGLGHSDVFGSAMTYSVFKGQHSLHTDDIAGVDEAYNITRKNGIISGKVVGGNLVDVFGAQVQAISATTGKVVSGVLTSEDGTFSIKNLDTKDSYMIYILPPRSISHLPSYYASIQSRYCGDREYVPSFFTKCGGRNKGKPQVINLQREEEINIGYVSIKCDTGVRPDYLFSKNQDPREEVLIHQAGRFIGENSTGVFQGYFSQAEIKSSSANIVDKLRIDLTNMVIPNDGTYYLDLKIINSELGSNFKMSGKLESPTGTTYKSAYYDSNGKLNTLMHFQSILSSTTGLNSFLLTLNPAEASNNEKNGMFGNWTVMSNSNSTYIVVINIYKNIGNGLELADSVDSYPYDDNQFCTEGDITFTSKANIVGSSFDDATQTKDDQNAQPVSCGTIDIDNGPGSGGNAIFSLGMGLLLVFFMPFILRKSNDFFV